MNPGHPVVLITGGNGALGQSVVPAFARAGRRVVVVDRHVPPAVEGGIGMQADVTDEADIRRVLQDVRRQAGPVEVLVNLVGGFATGRVLETDMVVWQRMLVTNLTSAFLLSKAVLPEMMERKTGRILQWP